MKQTIQVIQGDTLNLKVSVSSSHDLIERVIFSSQELNIIQDLIKIENEELPYWLLVMNETSNLPSCYTTFDITILLDNEETQTVVYNGNLNILPKGNKVYGD